MRCNFHYCVRNTSWSTMLLISPISLTVKASNGEITSAIKIYSHYNFMLDYSYCFPKVTKTPRTFMEINASPNCLSKTSFLHHN